MWAAREFLSKKKSCKSKRLKVSRTHSLDLIASHYFRFWSNSCVKKKSGSFDSRKKKPCSLDFQMRIYEINPYHLSCVNSPQINDHHIPRLNITNVQPVPPPDNTTNACLITLRSRLASNSSLYGTSVQLLNITNVYPVQHPDIYINVQACNVPYKNH